MRPCASADHPSRLEDVPELSGRKRRPVGGGVLKEMSGALTALALIVFTSAPAAVASGTQTDSESDVSAPSLPLGDGWSPAASSTIPATVADQSPSQAGASDADTRSPTPIAATHDSVVLGGASTTTVTVGALADSYVARNSASSNYGSSSVLRVDASPTEVSYLKFDLSAYAGRTLRSAALQVRTAGNGPSGSTGHQNIRLVNNDSWSEGTITYRNRPALGTGLGSLRAPSTGTSYSVPLSVSAIAKELGGRLSVGMDSSSGDSLYLTSSETSTAPKLVLSFSDGTTTTSTTGLADMLDMNLQSGDWPAVGNYVTTGDKGPYVGVHHGNHIYVRNDPKGVQLNGATRKVLQFRTNDSDTGPTRNPRTQFDGPLMIREGQEIWWGFAYLLPTGFPTKVERGSVSGNPFHTLGGNGDPEGDSSSILSFGSYGGAWRFGIRYKASGRWVWSMPRVENKWIDVVFRIKYKRDSTGFVEVYKNEGSGWAIQTLDSYVGGGTRWTGQTAYSSEEFPKRPRIANYFLKDQYKHLGIDPVSIYITEHKIATTFAKAKPNSYG